MFPAWLSALCALLIAQSQPTFRTQVELLRLDVSVVDKSGQPVRDLGADDFIVKIDGKPRAVSFARFYGPEETRTRPEPATPPSFATNTEPVQGRVVVIVVDLASMTPGYEKLVLDTAGSLVGKLGPSDSVGLILIPGEGIELTRDHQRVREALERARGFATDSGRDHAMTVREAEAFGNDDRRVMTEVVERECRPSDQMCPTDLRREARQLLIDADQQIRNLLTTMTDLYGNLATIDAPRTVVLLSAGLPYRRDSDSYFRDLRRRSAESGITTYVVQLDQPETDASARGKPGTGSLMRGDLAEGLSSVAGATGASLYAGVGRALGVFDRIQSEIVHTYQLGVTSVPADADGKTHKIEVEVNRPGAVIRARTEFIVAKTRPAAHTAVGVLGLPPGLSELPLTVATYNTRGEDATTLKVVVLLESHTGSPPATPPSYAFTIVGPDDRTVFQTAGTMKAAAGGATVIVAAQIAPGRYRLRGAVVDAQGRAGSAELPLAVGMRAAADMQFSDLIVGSPSAGFTPSSHVRPPRVEALIELYSTDPGRFDNVTVELELAKDGTILAHGAATIARTALERRRIAQGTMEVPELEPGTYVVSAVVKRSERPFASVSRTVVR